MTESIKYLWMLLCEESSYIFMLMLIVGTAAVMSFFLQRLFVSWWGKAIILIMCIVVAITEVFVFIEALLMEWSPPISCATVGR